MKRLQEFSYQTKKISERLEARCIAADISEQRVIASSIKHHKGVLLTEWIAPQLNNEQELGWNTLYLLPQVGLYWITSPISAEKKALIDLSDIFPVANRLQRTIAELNGIQTPAALDQRTWLNHGNWDLGILGAEKKPTHVAAYAFHKVAGEGVHEIPVGPVHAGIIEPGHFRFSVVGERILKLEERLGYTHKGIHSLLLNQSIEQAVRIISRVSGDSTVAYAWAFAMACENAAQFKVRAEVALYRAILLERERLINHIGDIGAIINDAGMPSLQSQFTMLKEKIVRCNYEYLQHRYLMDLIKPFQAQQPLSTSQLTAMQNEMRVLTINLQQLESISNSQEGLQDRLMHAGILSLEIAEQLGVIGLTARASGIDLDLRRLFPVAPYHLATISALEISAGDVEARFIARFKECFTSINLITHFIKSLQQSQSIMAENNINQNCNDLGLGCVEGWRGPVSIIIKLNAGIVQWCHFHDPSWQNWPALEHAVLDNIVADFPLINKSFNLSYSGQDS